MTGNLPDVATQAADEHAQPLDWVGMENIALPITLQEPDGLATSPCRVDIGVDLPGGEGAVKGIHMSRLYRMLERFSASPLTPDSLTAVLTEAVASHRDCETRSAECTLRFPFMLRRPALVSEGPGGWHSYPVRIRARRAAGAGHTELTLAVEVTYSSTCPCSAALSRRALAEAFADRFRGTDAVSVDTVTKWLEKHGTLAVPHSQRSLACVTVHPDPAAHALGLVALIDAVERTLHTPVQTMVKRRDEQAFARRNGDQPMYVEDAGRLLARTLSPRYPGVAIKVRHLESLHAHDAVATVDPDAAAAAGWSRGGTGEISRG
ncbi:GTP cyclohydrolase FolE2 [Arhodomonas aquaeolei]|uniref:GTP cyclohydrolase FolE2 n=1 Tax=Arhodomonas aquaeolei TaxID=2369 RepID=UPI0021698344|nr:GTP cyclohydrolase FolE2 [Arhodomonas aquaeolei]MCS4504271.1 GTP cyclohydrolase FolE2 [Arhodomonas aquaeolei]